jgi:hypothetical protein
MVREACAVSAIPVLLTVLPTSAHPPTQVAVAALDWDIVKLGQQRPVEVIDAARGLPTWLLADGVHPGDAGNEPIAHTIARAG